VGGLTGGDEVNVVAPAANKEKKPARRLPRARKAAITMVSLSLPFEDVYMQGQRGDFVRACLLTSASVRPFLPSIPWLHQTPTALDHLRSLAAGPSSSLLRIGVRTKGCAGMAYHLEYVDAPGKLDDVVEQDGVKVVIDSKALMTIIGSEMDWVEDRLRSVGNK